MRVGLVPGSSDEFLFEALLFRPISSAPIAGEPAAPPENTVPAPRRPTEVAARALQGGYAEWDLSSTLFREPLGLSSVISCPLPRLAAALTQYIKINIMNKSHITRAGRSFGPAVKSLKLAALLPLCSTVALAAQAGTDNRAPEVPQEIVVPAGNKVHFHGFGVGVQIYTWNGTSWGAAVPEATLFDGNGVVAIHFAGPTWESNSGSQVVGALPPVAVTVDTNAIPWLRLQAVEASTHGPGIFADTTYIQRVNTTGGKAPSTDGAFVGQVARVPYSADYYFYRKTTN